MVEESEDFRLFVRSLMARSDRYMRETLERSDRRFERWEAQWRADSARKDATLAKLLEHADERRAAHKAMLEGFMRMLDRLPPPKDGPATA